MIKYIEENKDKIDDIMGKYGCGSLEEIDLNSNLISLKSKAVIRRALDEKRKYNNQLEKQRRKYLGDVYEFAKKRIPAIRRERKLEKEYYLIPFEGYEPFPFVLTAEEIIEENGMRLESFNTEVTKNGYFAFRDKYSLVPVNDTYPVYEYYQFRTIHEGKEYYNGSLQSLRYDLNYSKALIGEMLLDGRIDLVVARKQDGVLTTIEELEFQYPN